MTSKSPKNKKDTGLKLQKYQNAGVREYWLIYPAERQIVVYSFENGGIPTVYNEHDKVPVSIFNGECEINLGEIFEYVDSLGIEET